MEAIQPFLDSTEVQDNAAALSERASRDGYLFIRGLLPRESLESLRLTLLKIMRDSGWVKAGTPLEDAVADPNGFCVEPDPRYNDVYARMCRLQPFHALKHHPNLFGVLERVLGEPVMVHPLAIGRTIFPKREAYTTPPHQDFIPIQGTRDTYSAWMPLSDLPAGMGGVQFSSGSHKHGVYNFKPALGASGMSVTDPLEGPWVGGPMKQGDVLFFHSLTVHKGVPNTSDRLRMSMDCRYQKISDPINPNCLGTPLRESLTWEQIYADWPSDDGKYYWKKYNMRTVEYDTSYHEQRDEMAFEMAAQGDDEARSTLQRIFARDPDQAKVAKAEELLAELDNAAE